MPKVEPIVTTAYKVGDKVFDTLDEATRHANIIAVADLLETTDVVDLPDVEVVSTIARVIVDHFDELHAIMRGDASCRDC